ncbi:hypothetical protein LJB76_02835 [Clostridia bacterium OttesenSCG-928-O13]|nr:hypothetical protein [Clostridia bacterium OttesenSCG-928-O13]
MATMQLEVTKKQQAFISATADEVSGFCAAKWRANARQPNSAEEGEAAWPQCSWK